MVILTIKNTDTYKKKKKNKKYSVMRGGIVFEGKMEKKIKKIEKKKKKLSKRVEKHTKVKAELNTHKAFVEKRSKIIEKNEKYQEQKKTSENLNNVDSNIKELGEKPSIDELIKINEKMGVRKGSKFQAKLETLKGVELTPKQISKLVEKLKSKSTKKRKGLKHLEKVDKETKKLSDKTTELEIKTSKKVQKVKEAQISLTVFENKVKKNYQNIRNAF